MRGRDFVGDMDQVRNQVALIVDEAEADWAQCARTIRLEFVLSTELINLPVDQWSADPDDVTAMPLGVRYQVVVRSLQLMLARHRHRQWRIRWDSMMDSKSGVVVRADADDPQSLRALAATLVRDPGQGILVLDEAPATGSNDVLRVGLNAGVPVMLWSRERRADDGFAAAVDYLSGVGDLREAVRLIRGEAFSQPNPDDHIGSRLALLRDDPSRMIPSLEPLSEPSH